MWFDCDQAPRLKFCKWAVSLVGMAVLVFLVWHDLAHPGLFRSEGRLHGKLSRVGFQFDSWGLLSLRTSEWQGQWLWTDDPLFLEQVESWLRSLGPPPACENALKQCGGRIVLVFRNGRQEEILFRGPDRPGPSGARCYGFVWDGHQVRYQDEPFSDFLSKPPLADEEAR
jgi:hypothetical protein